MEDHLTPFDELLHALVTSSFRLYHLFASKRRTAIRSVYILRAGYHRYDISFIYFSLQLMISTAIVLALRNHSECRALCNLCFLSFLAKMCNIAVVQQKRRTYVNIGSKLGQYVFRFEKIIYATKGLQMTADAYRIVCSVWLWQHSINIHVHTSDNDNTRYARSVWSTFICDLRIVCMYERN